MRTIHWLRHEYGMQPPEPRTGSLLAFIHDIPYFGAEGVLPPYPLINQCFSGGGDTGGMSPGATWAPFSIDAAEYSELVIAAATVDLATLPSRYAGRRFIVDDTFAGCTDLGEWIRRQSARERGLAEVPVAPAEAPRRSRFEWWFGLLIVAGIASLLVALALLMLVNLSR